MFFKLLYKQTYKHKKANKSFLRFVGFLYNYAKSTFWGMCIIRKADNATVSKIIIRIGNIFHSYYNGHIGYEVSKACRGDGYAYKES